MAKLILFIFTAFLTVHQIPAQNAGDKVYSVFEDEYGCQWFGTDKGLLRKKGEIWTAYNTQSGFAGQVNYIRQNTTGGSEIWLGTTKGIVKIRYSAKSVTSSEAFESDVTTFHSDTISSITFDNKNSGYFSTPKGIGVLIRSIWSFYTKFTDIIKSDLTSVHAEGDTIYLGTRGEGVARIVRNADGFTGASAYARPFSELTGDSITCIYFDQNGYNWYGTTKGISRHSGNESRSGWNFSLTKELPDQYVTSITGDCDHNIWIGTKGGIVILNSDSRISKILTIANGLPSNIVNCIFISKDKSVWIGTNSGVAHYDGRVIINFRTSDLAKDYIDL